MCCSGHIVQFLYQKETQRVQMAEMKQNRLLPSHFVSCSTPSASINREANI